MAKNGSLSKKLRQNFEFKGENGHFEPQIWFSTKLAIIPKQVNEQILEIVSQTSKG